MPRTRLLLFAEDDGTTPLLEWLDGLQKVKARDKCIARLERLAQFGHELRRPDADYLRDGIHELRVVHESVQYRILYFFHRREAVVSHGFIKKRAVVPPNEIYEALRRKRLFESDPAKYEFRR